VKTTRLIRLLPVVCESDVKIVSASFRRPNIRTHVQITSRSRNLACCDVYGRMCRERYLAQFVVTLPGRYLGGPLEAPCDTCLANAAIPNLLVFRNP
jgi:hypothetical protein